MAGQISGKQAADNMEHMLKLLHMEWERSGRTRAEISIETADIREVGACLAWEIQKRQAQIEAEEMIFKQSMALSRENFILLRLAKKIKKAGEKAERKTADIMVKVELDIEEYKLFSTLIEVKEE